MEKTKRKNVIFALIACAIILFGFFLRLKMLSVNLEFWHDESSLGLNLLKNGYLIYFKALDYAQAAPPMFLIWEKFLASTFGFKDIVIKITPFLFGGTSLILFYFFAKKFLNSGFAILLSLYLFAINTPLILYSSQFKPYGIEAFFTILIILIAMNLNFEKRNLKWAFLFAFIPWFSYASVFVLAAVNLIIFTKNIKTHFKNVILFFVPQAVSALILYLGVIKNCQNSEIMHLFWGKYFLSIKSFVPLFLNSFTQIFVSAKGVLVIMLAASFFIGAFLFYKKDKEKFAFLILPIIILMSASFLRFYPFGERLLLFLAPIYIILIIKPFDTILNKNKIPFLLLCLAFAFAIFYGSAKIKLTIPKEHGNAICNTVKTKSGKSDIFYIYPKRFTIRYYCSLNNTDVQFREIYDIENFAKNKTYWLVSLNNQEGYPKPLDNKELEAKMKKYGKFETYILPSGFLYRFLKIK